MKKQRSKFLWITDPWKTLDHPGDTTLRLIEESLKFKIDSYWTDVRSIRLEKAELKPQIKITAHKMTTEDCPQVRTLKKNIIDLPRSSSVTLSPSSFDQIHYRVDPPLGFSYLHPLQLLCLEGRTRAKIVNPPKVLFLDNEKFFTALFEGLMPPLLVSSSEELFLRFCAKEKKVVLKPLYQAQSKGVELLEHVAGQSLELLKKQLALATENFTRPIILQKFLPGILDGEKRLWFIDAKLLGYAKKVPKQGTFKIDMDQGASLVLTELSAKEKAISKKISKILKQSKIRLAAVDLIEGFVTDFNFTSPGLLPQMEALLGQNLAGEVIKSLLVL